jgi:hypothetical protein
MKSLSPYLLLTFLLSTSAFASAKSMSSCENSSSRDADQKIFSKVDCEKLCSDYLNDKQTQPIINKKVKKRKHLVKVKVEQPAAPQVIIVQVPQVTTQPAIPIKAEKSEDPNYWLKLSTGLNFSQFSLDDGLGDQSKILSDSSLKFDIENIFLINPRLLIHFNFGIQTYSLESPPNQQLDHPDNTLYNFGVGATWLGPDHLSLTGKLGYRHELYFRNYTSPTINIDKFLVPYAELSGKYFFYNNKTLKIGAIGSVGFSPGFTASISGEESYGIDASPYYNYGIVIDKDLTNFQMEASILESQSHQSSSQGTQDENNISVNLSFKLPVGWGE